MAELSKERKGRITGSSVGAILGLSPFMKPADVMRRMVREWHDAEPEFKGNVATEYGHKKEPVAMLDYEMYHASEALFDSGFFIHPEYDWLGATPDALIGDNGVLEIKCPYGLRNTDAPVRFKPLLDKPHYFAQIQIEMACSHRMFSHFYQWCENGDSLEEVAYSQTWFNENLPKLQEFYDAYLIEREFPACQRHLEPRHKEQDDRLITDLVIRHAEIAQLLSELEGEKKALSTEIIARCGERESLVAGHKISRVVRKGNVQYNKIPELAGVDLEQYRGTDSVYWTIK